MILRFCFINSHITTKAEPVGTDYSAIVKRIDDVVITENAQQANGIKTVTIPASPEPLENYPTAEELFGPSPSPAPNAFGELATEIADRESARLLVKTFFDAEPKPGRSKPEKNEKPEAEPPAALIGAAQSKFSESLFEGTLMLEISLASKNKVVAVARNRTEILHRNEISLNKALDRQAFIAALCLTDEQRPLINQAMLRLADQVEKVCEHSESREHLPGGFTIPQQLIGIADEFAEIFHDASGDGYASVEVDGHRETYKLGSRDFKEWLGGMFYEISSEVAASEKITEAIAVLRHKAKRAEEREVNVRIAEHAGAIYLDLCNKEWRQIEIAENGWGLIESKDSPVRFRRAGGMLALPEPLRGGELSELRELLNLPAEDSDNWPLILGWLVATFKPCNPAGFDYPVLAIHGEQGSAKSTACRLLRRLIDPNKADLRATPKDERDLAIAAEHGRVLGFDNLTYLSDSLSNALCRMATGGGFATRELFTDEGEIIFDSQRPVILNGIAEVVSKSDLLDRAILIYLPQIERNARKLRRVIDRKFVAAQPRILGALLTAVSKGLQKLKQGVTLDELPRMADFAEWVTACEPGLGLDEGQFIKAYTKNEAKANSLAIEASPVGQAIIAFIETGGDWIGSMGELLKALNVRLEANQEDPKKKNGWPKSPRGLGAKLKEIAPNLRRSGMIVKTGDRQSKGCMVELAKAKPEENPKPEEKREDVHNVHNVHGANEINDLDREHLCEHLKNAQQETFTGDGQDSDREHPDLADLADVHTNVHSLNYSEQRDSVRCEHREHLSTDPRPAWQQSTTPLGEDGEPMAF